jgi:hypothetical protein
MWIFEPTVRRTVATRASWNGRTRKIVGYDRQVSHTHPTAPPAAAQPPGKPERTRDFVLAGMANVQQAFADEGLIANLRLETYEGERYFHVPPPPTT